MSVLIMERYTQGQAVRIMRPRATAGGGAQAHPKREVIPCDPAPVIRPL
jgi:hypothetical protein